MSTEQQTRLILRDILDQCGADDPDAIVTDEALSYLSKTLIDWWNEGFKEGQADGAAYPFGGAPYPRKRA